MIGRRIKNPKKSEINNHILPEGQGTMMISLFFKVEQMFSSYFRKNLLMKKDQQELNGNVRSHPMGLFD